MGDQGEEVVDVVVVGAGFAGLYALYRLRTLGFSVKVIEAADGVGGTWHWNRYPGARCDVESMEYSYSFSDDLQREWEWSERYASQPEILRYLNHVADRFDLRPDVELNTRVTAATFDEESSRWRISTDRGKVVTARFCVMATGCLSAPKAPELEGLETFEGKWYLTGAWPHEGVDFDGLDVGVIGTGSTGIQLIPMVAKQARRLYVFQRTPNFSVPARNTPLTDEVRDDWRGNHRKYRRVARRSRLGILIEPPAKPATEASAEEREREYERRWSRGGPGLPAAYKDILRSEASNETLAEFVRAKIRSVVRDPAVAEALSPKDYPIGAKRLCLDTNYFETYNRENVTLVNLRETPIQRITSDGIKTSEAEYRLDAIAFATGFDAMTGALCSIDIRGREGVGLKDKWAAGPRAYLGLMVAGFPNLFTITGPGSPSVLSNMVVSIEQHVDWIADCLTHLRERGRATIEATAEAEEQWVEHVAEVGDKTLYPRANSWYVGANVPGKPRVFMPYVGGVGIYRKKCDEIVADGYRGFLTA